MTEKQKVDWQPVVDSLAFALKAGALVTVVALLNATNPDITELKSGAMAALIAGVVRHYGDRLPPMFRA